MLWMRSTMALNVGLRFGFKSQHSIISWYLQVEWKQKNETLIHSVDISKHPQRMIYKHIWKGKTKNCKDPILDTVESSVHYALSYNPQAKLVFPIPSISHLGHLESCYVTQCVSIKKTW